MTYPWLRGWLALMIGATLAGLGQAADVAEEPELWIPSCSTPPVVDGRLSPGEWDGAAAVTGLMRYPAGQDLPGLRGEQAVIYLCRCGDNLYLAMDSYGTSCTEITVGCLTNDSAAIVKDDAFEWMVAPGAGPEINDPGFPVYYFIVNAAGTRFDQKILANYNEAHSAWRLPAEVRSTTDGMRWILEMRAPLSSFGVPVPAVGAKWRMNFIRTYPLYRWSAWRIKGGFNSPHTAGAVTLGGDVPAVRVRSVQPLIDGKFALEVETANLRPESVAVNACLTGRRNEPDHAEATGEDRREIEIGPGETGRVVLGSGTPLTGKNLVSLEVTRTTDGARLFFDEYAVNLPVTGFEVKPPLKRPSLYVFARYLPSRKRLAVIVNYRALAPAGDCLVAEIAVKNRDSGVLMTRGTLKSFAECEGTWRWPAGSLAEGAYTVEVVLRDGTGRILAEERDWFDKKQLPWLDHPVGIGDLVPAPFTPLAVAGSTVSPWGRAYDFGRDGLLGKCFSQGLDMLAGRAVLSGSVAGRPVRFGVDQPCRVVRKTRPAVTFRSSLTAPEMRVDLDGRVEYDGFIKYALRYGPAGGKHQSLDSLRLSIPLKAEYARFYSAFGDSVGTNIQSAVLPVREGLLFDSLNDLGTVALPANFASLLWLGDRSVSFCYAADSDEGWLTDPKKPCVRLERRGEVVWLHLDFVSRPSILDRRRTVVFALQAGPVKPLPEGWRGIYHSNDPSTGPLCWTWCCTGGWNYPVGAQLLHPGTTPEEWRVGADLISKKVASGVVQVDYNWYAHVPKAEVVRYLRGELGIDRYTWESENNYFMQGYWKLPAVRRVLGDDRDLYTIIEISPVPAYIDLLSYAFDLAVAHTGIEGFYDDTGYPRPVYDAELALGYVREDGRKIPCAGLFLYRERWKRAQYILWQRGKRNFLSDTQHIAHLMPVYGFCGIFNGCEQGYSNPVWTRDNYDMYGSLDRYSAYTPFAAMGMLPCFGLSSPQKDKARLKSDTRSMLLLTMLNDQDLGGWQANARDQAEIRSVRTARNRFRPWEKDVRYLGYWEEPARCSPSVRTSVYYAPRGTLLVVGNTSREDTAAVVSPDWARLGLDPRTLKFVDAESGADIPVENGTLKTAVPGHDLRLILGEKK